MLVFMTRIDLENCTEIDFIHDQTFWSVKEPRTGPLVSPLDTRTTGNPDTWIPRHPDTWNSGHPDIQTPGTLDTRKPPPSLAISMLLPLKRFADLPY